MHIDRRGALLGGIGTALSMSALSQPIAQASKSQCRPTEPHRLPKEPALEPDIPIIDAHHHLWFLQESLVATMKSLKDPLAPIVDQMRRYLFEEYLKDIRESGHNVMASVYMEAGSMYRAQGPEVMRPVGEIEFANGVAAEAASETFGKCYVCAGIVGSITTTEPHEAERLLNGYVQAGNGRFRGVRAHFMDEGHSYLEEYRNTTRVVQRLGLSLDVVAIEPKLGEVRELVQAFPDTVVIVNHVGLPMGIGRYKGKREERFPIWRNEIRRLAKYPNVTLKLGGLGMPYAGLPSYMSPVPATSEQLAREWKPYIHTCIEEFGADRCMFESDFPADALTCSYSTMWNTFKLLAHEGSADEKRRLFHDTAQRVYKLSLPTQ